MSTHNIFVTLGASNHTDHDRADFDYYATHPSAAEMLLRMESFSHKIWEPACGEKHLSNVFERHGYEVRSSDIVDRCGNEVLDFLSMENTEPWEGDIITNPPFKYAMDFIERSLQLVTEGHKVAMFVRLQFLEGKSRKSLYINTPPNLCTFHQVA